MSHSLEHKQLDRRHRWAYHNTAPATVNHAIEAFLYEPALRRQFGLRWAVNLYAATGVITNSLYTKSNPSTLPRSSACAVMLAASRTWTRLACGALRQLARQGQGAQAKYRSIAKPPSYEPSMAE